MKKLLCTVFAFVLLSAPFSVSALGTNAKAAILINGDTGEVIYSQNADERLPMASTTKIMTSLLLCEHGDFNREITVTAEMLRVEGSSMGLLAGDRVTLHDLLYGMMLASGNDAANVTAYILGGTVNGFVKMMNDKAAELGLENTHFVTPSGLDADEHYTTARDLANLTRYAMQNEEFYKAASSKSATLNYGNPPYRRTLTNHNRLLKSFETAVGVKTGFTKKSGRCLVSAAAENGKLAIAVTLNDPNDWNDHKQMLSYGLSAINRVQIAAAQENYAVAVVGSDTESIDIAVKPYTISALDASDVSCEVYLPKFVYAPLKRGEVVGAAVYKKGSEVVATEDLCCENNIERSSERLNICDLIMINIKYIFIGIWEK